MSRFKNLLRRILTIVSLSVPVSLPAANAFARPVPVWMGPYYGRYGGPSFYAPHGCHQYLPAGYVTIRLADVMYYYCDGVYYTHTPSGYVVVSAPVGATVTGLPDGYRTLVYDHATYYIYDRAYYVKDPGGYVVVTPPPSAVTLNSAAVEAPEKTVVVNVPNPNGSYIPVTLQKYSDGYIGPRGEYYADYPTIEQLKAMYAITSAIAAAPEAPEELTLDVPNANGSYTKVKLVKSEKGYVGPEGEFYPDKPTIDQLKKMYAK